VYNIKNYKIYKNLLLELYLEFIIKHASIIMKDFINNTKIYKQN